MPIEFFDDLAVHAAAPTPTTLHDIIAAKKEVKVADSEFISS